MGHGLRGWHGFFIVWLLWEVNPKDAKLQGGGKVRNGNCGRGWKLVECIQRRLLGKVLERSRRNEIRFSLTAILPVLCKIIT